MKRYLVAPAITLIGVGLLVWWGWRHHALMPLLMPQGPIALAESQVLGITFLITSIIVVPVFAMLFSFAWVFRAGNPKTRREHKPELDHENPLAEFSWWLVPSLIIIFLGFVAWQSSHQLDPYVPIKGTNAPITVQVVALDWKWLFIYPDDHVATVNYLEIPVNTPIHLVMTADAPMNSLWVPSLAGQIMVMPGMQTQLNLAAAAPGSYDGYSGNISGSGFSGMHFTVKAVSSDTYSAWVADTKTQHTTLDAASYDSLARPSSYVPSQSFAQVNGDLFDRVMMKYMQMGTPHV